MSLDRNHPGPPLSRIGLWGRPWHGLVQGGVLTLPNAETMPHVQPDGSIHWEYSACHVLARPDVPEIERTPEQQEADEAAGRQWLNYALMSGGSSLLYGVPLGPGKFIWVDDNGDRWLVDASALHGQTWGNTAIPASVNITIRRFGVFGQQDEPRNITVTVPSLGQSDPEVYSTPTAVATAVGSSLYSVHPQGRKAAFMLHYALTWTNALAWRGWPSGRHPCGWFELELLGTGEEPAAQINLIADRLTTLGGAGASSESGGGFDDMYYMWLRTRTENQEGFADYPDCAGHQLRYTDTQFSQASPGEGWVQTWFVLGPPALGMTAHIPYSSSDSFDGMLMAIWYDAAGDRKAITLDMECSFEDTHELSGLGNTGQRIIRRNFSPGDEQCEVESVLLQDFDVSMSSAGTHEQSITFTWRMDGSLIDQVTLSETVTQNVSHRYWSDFNDLYYRVEVDTEAQISGAGWGDLPQSSATYNGFAEYLSPDPVNPGGISGGRSPAVFNRIDPDRMWPAGVTPGRRGYNLYGRSVNFWAPSADIARLALAPVRYGHAATGWMRASQRPSELVQFSGWGSVVTPGGAMMLPNWSAAGDVVFTVTPFSPIHVAYNPVAPGVALAASPLCFV